MSKAREINDYHAFQADFERLKHADEEKVLKSLLAEINLTVGQRGHIVERAGRIVEFARQNKKDRGTLDTFLQEFGLSNQEGVALMCLAEALLRVPDAETADELIAEKIKSGNWADHKGKSDSLLVNASTWGLMLTGGIINLDPGIAHDVGGFMKKLVTRSGEPVIRAAVMQAMRIMGEHFVLGRTIEQAMKRGLSTKGDLRHSFDMLGEGARTEADALRYHDAYAQAIEKIGAEAGKMGVYEGPGISVKLSALHPRYEYGKADTTFPVLYERVLELAMRAKRYDIGFTIDAEEADRLGLSMELLGALAQAPELKGWNGLGIALQAYLKRGFAAIDWLKALAKRSDRRLMVRLVKGAYWDTEIKHAQQLGLKDYPVFTLKPASDVSYLACARKLFEAPKEIFPQFATHNAHTLSAVLELAPENADFEFQRLHGMGDLLYKSAIKVAGRDLPCRVYAPVGSHEDLLPYLVRRLLENGANSSFVNSFLDRNTPVSDVVRDPLEAFEGDVKWRHPKIPLPEDIYGDERKNSDGIDLTDDRTVHDLAAALTKLQDQQHVCKPLVGGKWVENPTSPARAPRNRREVVGEVADATLDDCDKAIILARSAQPGWNALGGRARGEILRACADAMEKNRELLFSLLVREAGKTLDDCVAELREAVDFCRYYAAQAESKFETATVLPGPTGETNELFLEGKGVFVCISPWNFPLAIFAGQMMAALAAGNTVISKPAEQTPLIAATAIKLFHEAGIPGDVLQLLPGDGAAIGAHLVKDERVAGVAFTGSTETAQIINRTMAARNGAIGTLIAETGGLNGLFVDSTALIEQVTDDVIRSAFLSAGQRCSALRVLLVQRDIADKTIETIKGAMAELNVGNPVNISTDLGPIIDEEARELLEKHLSRMEKEGDILYRTPVSDDLEDGTYFAPTIAEIDSLDILEREVFGPFLHVLRYEAGEVDALISQLKTKGYGLTLGVHSRLKSFADKVIEQMPAGNAYINRDIVGAVVGVQPFGGCGLSGTGPKAGGPNYLERFANERVRTENTTAQGGNAALFCLEVGSTS